MNESFEALYSASLLKNLMDQASAEIQSYLTACQEKPASVLPQVSPNDMRLKAEQVLAQTRARGSIEEKFAEVARAFLNGSNHLHSPHYIGHQIPPTLMVPAVFAVVSAITNQGSSVYEMGPFNLAAEKVLIAELGSAIGWREENFDGIVTHGGSLANYTALLSARNKRYPDSWKKGIPPGVKPAIITSAESHYSNSRAAGMIGIGTDSVLSVPVDGKRRMNADLLEDLVKKSKVDGLDVFCIMASSCSTPVGAFDDLEAISHVAREFGIWLHVDGAHGASLLLSRKHRHLLRGIENADSITWDAHKMMFVQSLCTFLFFKDKAASYQTFEQKAPYLFSAGATDYDAALRTVECTKGSPVMAFFATWCALGPSVLEQLIDRVIAQAKAFFEVLKSQDDFEVIHEPQCNILCFRYIPNWLRTESRSVISDFQKKIRATLIDSGEFYITSTILDQVSALRVTVMNPMTCSKHFHDLLEAIRRIGSQD